MGKRQIDSSIPLYVESARTSEAQNRYATHGSVVRLAKIATEHPSLLRVLAGFVSIQARHVGYTKKSVGELRRRALGLSGGAVPGSVVKQMDKVMEEIAETCSSDAQGSATPEARKRIPNDMTAGITEAIVLRLLLASRRRRSDITENAFVYTGASGRKKINARNLDFVYAEQAKKIAEAFECRNQPARLMDEYYTREAYGNDAAWKKCKLYLMLKFEELLSQKGWRVLLACVTLRSRQRVIREINRRGGLPTNGRLEIYGWEQLKVGLFPPPIIQN